MSLSKLILLIFFLCSAYIHEIAAQKKVVRKYWVAFTDKVDSPFSILHPQDFLSIQALQRRAQNNIPIEENDLPVNPAYLKKIQTKGATIHNKSKWLNAATVISDDSTIQHIAALSFVDTVIYVGKHLNKSIFLRQNNKQRDRMVDYPKTDNIYGKGFRQIELMRGHALHQLGFEGDNKIVAVLDGGFINVDIMPFFDSLFEKQKMIPGWDFVDDDDYVYESNSHGSNVLSVMAADLPGLLIGTGPDAQYVCIKTEDTRGEYLVEECNWIAGAEFADSLGVDIINSSLGYTHFSDTSMNYDYSDMNGETSRASIAADIAFSKGLLVVNSAGNSGGDGWKYVGVPADAKNVLSVGATLGTGAKANFSSFGPTADGRMKPNVAAMGQFITVGSIYSYNTHPSNGTSFASPIIAGMAASLWSAFPEKSNQDIFDAIEQSGNQYDHPDNELGNGIPDFLKAYQILSGSLGHTFNDEMNELVIMQNDESGKLEMILNSQKGTEATITIKDLYGKKMREDSFIYDRNQYHKITIGNLPSNQFLLIHITIDGKTYVSYLKSKTLDQPFQIP